MGLWNENGSHNLGQKIKPYNNNLKKEKFVFLVEELYFELNYYAQKIRQTPTHDIRKHWTAVSTVLAVYTVISTSGDSTSDHRWQSWKSTTEPTVDIADKLRQIN